jgi:hypothetical protein
METNSLSTNLKSPAKRIRLNTPIIFRRKYSRREEYGCLKNVSDTGAFLSHKRGPLTKDEKIFLILDFLGHRREVVAIVVWTHEQGSGIVFQPHVDVDSLVVREFVEFVHEEKTKRSLILDSILKRIA